MPRFTPVPVRVLRLVVHGQARDVQRHAHRDHGEQRAEPPRVDGPDDGGADAKPERGKRDGFVASRHPAPFAAVPDVLAEPAVVDELLVEALGAARVAGGRHQQEHGRREQRKKDTEHTEHHEDGAAGDPAVPSRL